MLLGTRLCAPIKEDSVEAVEAACREADLIELRLDLFTPRDLEALLRACSKPIVFKVLEYDPNLLAYNPDYIDLPFGVGHDLALPVPRICSYHDEEKTPNLHALYNKMQTCPADYYKIATRANSSLDALQMLQFVRETGVIGLCMGALGEVTRILAPVFGAPLTYAPHTADQTTADGQLFLSELLEVYNFRSLTPETALYGLIGDPIDKSVGHSVHNRAFRSHNAVYVKMPVMQSEVCDFLSLSQKVGFRGLSVTMPLKEQILEGEVVNTIAFRDGGMECCNTDGVGACDALEHHTKLLEKRVVILGAGGAAQAIAREARGRGAHVVMANRTLARLPGLIPLEEFASQEYDILINCTPVCPVEVERLQEGKIVMDIVSQPRMTPFLQAAEAKQCRLVFGMEMWEEQARGQYRHWQISTASFADFDIPVNACKKEKSSGMERL